MRGTQCCFSGQSGQITTVDGFLNLEELNHADLAVIEGHPNTSNIGFFGIRYWVLAHNLELYVTDSFVNCLKHLSDDKPFANMILTPGHGYQLWSQKSEMKRMKAGIPSKLKNGYSGMQFVFNY